jgi:hypothetical protein
LAEAKPPSTTEKPADKKVSEQLTLETATRFANIEERLLKVETVVDTISTGQGVICEALKRGGLLTEDLEPVHSVWNPEKIPWKETEGARGKYQRYPEEREKAEATPDYKALLQDLKSHGGKLFRDGFFFWVFESDGATIGRKPKKEKEPETAEAKPSIIEVVKAKFPADLAQLLSFQVEGAWIIAKPNQFLGSENFARIAAITRELGGEYISEGKQSHFRIPAR